MATVAAPRRGPVRPPGALTLTAWGITMGLAAAGVTAVLVGNGTLKSVAILIVVVGTIWFAATRQTTLAMALLMLYLGLLDGYLKLATGSNLVTFVRDVLLYAICVGVLLRAIVERRPLSLPPLSGWVIAFSVLVVAQLANPDDGSLYHSLAGVRQQLEFVPLFFLAASFVRTKRALRWFLILMLAIGAANGVASWIQFNESPAQLASWGPGYAERVLGTGGFQFAGRTFYNSTGQQFTRPFGLGSDAGGGGDAGAFAIAGVLAMFLLARRRRGRLLFAVVMAAGAVVAIYTSEGRAAVISAVVIAFAFALLASVARGRKETIVAVGVGLAIAFFVVQAFVTTASSTTTRYSGLTAGKLLGTTSNARGRSYAQIPYNLSHFALGAGLGVAGPATGVKGGGPNAGNVDAENELSFLVVETGIPGAVVLISFTAMLFVLGARRVRLEEDSETRILLAAIIAPLGGMLALYLVSAATPTTPSGPYLWAVGGLASYWLVTRQAGLPAARTVPG